jgi:hypothetical protein
MQNRNQQSCLHGTDFSSYLAGATHGDDRVAVEQHLCDCSDCFDALVTTLNQHLDHPELQPQVGATQDARPCF